MADDIPARSDRSLTSAEPTTVPVSLVAGNKLAAAADRIVSSWRERHSRAGLLQIVFHDPVPDDGDPHGELREMLVARGMPRSAITLTSDAAEPVGNSRNDPVSVVITSTDSADVAVAAAHGRDIGVHHLDLPRSNLAAHHRAQADSAASSGDSAPLVFRYVTTGTPDSLRWEALDRKEAFIAQVLALSPDLPVGDEGPSDSQISYGELKALADDTADGVPVQGAFVAEVLTEDGQITLSAGSDTGGVPLADARFLVDLVNGRRHPAGTPSFNSATGTLTVPVPGGRVTISPGT